MSLMSHALISVALLAVCSNNPTAPSAAMAFVFDFGLGSQGFVAGFADYPPGQESSFRLMSDHVSYTRSFCLTLLLLTKHICSARPGHG